MARLGISFSGGPNASEIVKCVKLAESLGCESAWVAEGHGGGGGRSALPGALYSRHRLEPQGPGRAEHGMEYTKPLTRVRETVEFTRALLAEGEAQYHGETVRIENFELWFTPLRRRLPIYLSAVFPKMTELCGEIADGVILTRSTLENGAKMRAHLVAGAAKAGWSAEADAMTISSLLPVAIADSRAAAFDRMRPGFAAYTGYFPRYNRMTADQGFAEEAAAIGETWARGDREAAAAAVSNELIDATAIAGTAADCRAKIAAYRDSGLDLPILSPFARGANSKAVFEEVIRACAPEA